jgi:hypothetical protein
MGLAGFNMLLGFAGLLGLRKLAGFKGLFGLSKLLGLAGLLGFRKLIGFRGLLGLSKLLGFAGLLGLRKLIGFRGLLGLSKLLGLFGFCRFDALHLSLPALPFAPLNARLSRVTTRNSTMKNPTTATIIFPPNRQVANREDRQDSTPHAPAG